MLIYLQKLKHLLTLIDCTDNQHKLEKIKRRKFIQNKAIYPFLEIPYAPSFYKIDNIIGFTGNIDGVGRNKPTNYYHKNSPDSIVYLSLIDPKPEKQFSIQKFTIYEITLN